MSMDPNNPYASFAVGGTLPTAGGPASQMDYGAAVKAPFGGEGSIASLLLGGLCLMFSCLIVPAMIFLGYAYECAEHLIVSGGQRYLQFDTGRVNAYLSRGWVPWLVIFVFTIANQCISYMMQIVVLGLVAAVAGNGDEANLVGVLITLPLSFGLSFLFYFIVTAATIQAGLTQDIGKAFDFGWIFDFAGKMWKELLLAYLVFLAVAIVAYIAGLAMLCVGVIPAIAYVMMVNVTLQSQLYSVYISRGGRPLPFKQDPSTMPVYGPGPGTPGSNPFT